MGDAWTFSENNWPSARRTDVYGWHRRCTWNTAPNYLVIYSKRNDARVWGQRLASASRLQQAIRLLWPMVVSTVHALSKGLPWMFVMNARRVACIGCRAVHVVRSRGCRGGGGHVGSTRQGSSQNHSWPRHLHRLFCLFLVSR